jgi:hypothetical protein
MMFLAGAALVVAPIVLHLVMRQKPRRLEFPALRLVARRQGAKELDVPGQRQAREVDL